MVIPTKTSRGGAVLIGALVIDSVGNGLFLSLSLVFFTQLTDVPLGLLGVLISVANALTVPIPVWAGVLVDRLGALPLVIGAQVMQALGYLAYRGVTEPVGILLAMSLVAVGVRFFRSSAHRGASRLSGTAARGTARCSGTARSSP
jgi:hypothetical protein